MLSKAQQRYLEDPERFLASHGLTYTHVIRSRIRKKVRRALADLRSILASDRPHSIQDAMLRIRAERGGFEERRALGLPEPLLGGKRKTEPLLPPLDVSEFLHAWLEHDPSAEEEVRKLLDRPDPL